MGLLDQFRGEKIPAAFNENTPDGFFVSGKITDVSVQERTDFKTGDVLYFKDGKPKLQVVVTIQTDMRDPSIEKDDGRRRIYAKMDYRSDRLALIKAVEEAGDDDIHVGGSFAAQMLGYLTGEDGKPNAWKSQKFEYRKPSSTAGLLSTPDADRDASGATAGGSHPVTAVSSQPPAVATPPTDPAAMVAKMLADKAAAEAAAKPAAPALDAATAEAIRSLIAGGFDNDAIVGAFPTVSREILVALRHTVAA